MLWNEVIPDLANEAETVDVFAALNVAADSAVASAVASLAQQIRLVHFWKHFTMHILESHLFVGVTFFIDQHFRELLLGLNSIFFANLEENTSIKENRSSNNRYELHEPHEAHNVEENNVRLDRLSFKVNRFPADEVCLHADVR